MLHSALKGQTSRKADNQSQRAGIYHVVKGSGYHEQSGMVLYGTVPVS